MNVKFAQDGALHGFERVEMARRQIECMDCWITLNTITGPAGTWSYQIDLGPIRGLASSRPKSSDEALFSEAFEAAKAETDRAHHLLKMYPTAKTLRHSQIQWAS